MRQRGRKSADNLVALVVDGRSPRLMPPAYLNKSERSLFGEMINACASDHFAASDLPLLASLVQATLIARRAARDPGKLAEWERAVRVQAMLSTKLRLTAQSRTDPKSVARRLPPAGPPPWEK
jgi:hypothetical protein